MFRSPVRLARRGFSCLGLQAIEYFQDKHSYCHCHDGAVAVVAGPQGVAQLGRFMSLTALLLVFSGGGLGPGVVKYLAKCKGGDAKVAALLLSYVMLAKAMARIFLFSEVFFGFTYFSWAVVFTQQFGLIGSIYAYLIYFIFLRLWRSDTELKFETPPRGDVQKGVVWYGCD